MRLIAMLLLAVLAAGCQRSAMISVTAEADPNVDFTQFHTLAVTVETDAAARSSHLSTQIAQAITDDLLAGGYHPAPPASQKPLVPADADTREEIAHVVRNAFAAKAIALSPADPQLLLTIDDLSGPYNYAVPLREIRISNDARSAESPFDDGSAILADQRSAVLPVRALQLSLYDVRKIDKPIWRATAITLHNAESLRTLAPYMIRAMLDEFPAPSGKPIQRQIPMPTN